MKPPNITEKLWRYVTINQNGCWVWGRHVGKGGYGQACHEKKQELAHRLFYRLIKGEIDGMTIDHLCKNRLCVNPDHLEAVSRAENTRRAHSGRKALFCRRGHPAHLPEHRYRNGRGNCIQCMREVHARDKIKPCIVVDQEIEKLFPGLPIHTARHVRFSKDGCWEWSGGKVDGYGMTTVMKKRRAAHRVLYTFAKGEIPEELTIDHLCRNRACVNPDHLEAVTSAENSSRIPPEAKARKKDTCVNGHPYAGNRQPENTGSYCIICNKEWKMKQTMAYVNAKLAEEGKPIIPKKMRSTRSLADHQVRWARDRSRTLREAGEILGLTIGAIQSIRDRHSYRQVPDDGLASPEAGPEELITLHPWTKKGRYVGSVGVEPTTCGL